jgi:hypothetical protein
MSDVGEAGDGEVPAEKKRPVPRSVEESERLIKDQAYETAYAWSRTRELLLEKDGERGLVAFSDEEQALLADSIFVHNHPGGSSFSDADLRFTCENNIAEMRGITSGRRYILRRPGGGWDSDYWWFVLGDSHKKHLLDVSAEYRNTIVSGTMTRDEARRDRWHEAMTRTADELGLEYLVEEL